jgi:FAD/FMN-containing dehydrogenase
VNLVAPRGFRGQFRTDQSARAVYGEAAGIARQIPRAVAAPADTADVCTLVTWAQDGGIAIVPRGSGSGMAGGAVGDGVVVDLSRLRTLSPIDVERQSVRASSGVLRGELDRAARAAGLRFPVDPSSGEFCTIGGMAATNAAGAHSLRHGSVRRWVRALECVFDDGSAADVQRGGPPPAHIPAIRRFLTDARELIIAGERTAPALHAGVRKDSSGYATTVYAGSGELVDLLVGSEGTLALFTSLEISLEVVPQATASVLGAFGSLDDAVRAAIAARAAGAAACELLDRTFLDIAATGGTPLPVPSQSEAVLLAEIEGASAGDVEDGARTVERLFRGCEAIRVQVALDANTERAIWELRRAASLILFRLDPSLKSMQFIEDGAVPPDRLADYVRGVRATLARHGVRGVIFGHAGDAHIHVNPLIDIRRADWRGQVEGILADVVALTASLGGTLSGEHGDGRIRTPMLPNVWSEASIKRFGLVKRTFDPAGILNPGVKVCMAGQQAVADVKYDPSLAPLPAAAARTIDHVERARAYGSFRLALLDGLSES